MQKFCINCSAIAKQIIMICSFGSDICITVWNAPKGSIVVFVYASHLLDVCALCMHIAAPNILIARNKRTDCKYQEVIREHQLFIHENSISIQLTDIQPDIQAKQKSHKLAKLEKKKENTACTHIFNWGDSCMR